MEQKKLTFRYELSGTTATAYSVYALTLYEQDVELQQRDVKIPFSIKVIILMELSCLRDKKQN